MKRHLEHPNEVKKNCHAKLLCSTYTFSIFNMYIFLNNDIALDVYHKADADLNLSRAEVEKQRMNSTIKSQQYDDCKNEYANQLQKTNELQNKYYNQMLPSVFESLQDQDERRIKCIKNFILKAVQAEKEVVPIISQCLDGMTQCGEAIDEKEDSRIVIEKYKSGFQPPNDIPFEDLSSADTTSVNGYVYCIYNN